MGTYFSNERITCSDFSLASCKDKIASKLTEEEVEEK
jgi:hypothetical protein